MRITKRVLSITLAVVILVSSLGIAVEAASVSLAKLNLGYMAPTNSKGTKLIETVKLYGDYDYINFYIKSKKKNSYFFYEIYSDKDYTKLVEGDVAYCNKGEYSFVKKIKLKKKYKSKTYYMVTYAGKVYSDGSAKIDKKSMREFKIKVDRKPDFDEKVVVLKETKNTTKGAYIKWGKLSGAKKYEIYRRSITGTKWKKVGTVSSKKTTFTDTSVKNKNGNYIYSVKAVNKKGKKSRMLYAGLTCLFAKTPVMSSVSVVADNMVQVKWGSTKSGAKYNVMRKEAGGSWVTIATNYAGTTYNDKTAVNGKKYTYSVKAVLSTDYGTATSSYYANDNKAVTYLKAPSIKGVTEVANGLEVSWNAVPGTNIYRIYRRPFDKSETWKQVGYVGSGTLTFTDTTASVDGAYIYTVRADAAKNIGSYYSAGVGYLKLAKPVVDVTRNEANNQVIVSWNSVTDATEYELFCKVADGEWQLLQKTTGLTYKYYLDSYGTFEYKVRAIKDKKYFSDYSDIVSYNHIPYISFSYMAFSDRIEMNWVDFGAEAYNIYRKPNGSPDEDFILLDTISGTNYTDFTLEQDVSYTYQIRGVMNGVEQTSYVRNGIAGINTADVVAETPKLQVKYDYLYFNTDAVIYGYNFADECWEEIDYIDGEGTQKNYEKYLNDGKYRFAFGYVRGGMKTPIDNSVIDYEWYDETVEFDAHIHNGKLVVNFSAADESVEKYVVVLIDGYKKEVVADGSKTYDVVFDHKTNWPGDMYMEILIYSKNGDITRTWGCPTLI